MTQKTAVVIITDEGFLLPSLVLARQIESNAEYASLANVLLFVIDFPEERLAHLQQTFGSDVISILPVSSDAIDLPTESSNFAGHVPVACLARLALTRFLPEEYENVVYLDGDVRIQGDISPLLTLRTQPGEVAAVVENFIMRDGDGGRPEWLDRDLDALGLTRASDYFNSGVLAFRADTWRQVGEDALAFYLQNEEKCRHHDQSALNAVLGGRWLRLGIGYNFQSFFKPLHAASRIEKRLIHFSSSPKPWASPDGVWDARLAEPYRNLLREHPELARPGAVFPESRASARAPLFYRRVKRRLRSQIKDGEKNRNLRKYLRETRFHLA